MMGVDKIGEIRRAHFEQKRSIKEIVRTLSVSRATVRKVIRSHKSEFKYERDVQPAPKLGGGSGADGDPGRGSGSAQARAALDAAAVTRSCADADTRAPTTACIGS